MAASPKIKIYTPSGDYEASCKTWETAASIVSFLGDGSTIRLGHKSVLWTEGVDGVAWESFSAVAEHCMKLASKLF